MSTPTPAVLPGTQVRSRYMRMDAANVLKRFFFAEQSLIVAQAGWLGWIESLEVKTTLPRFIWEDALTANALRERVFELRFPSRLLEAGSDAPLVAVFDEAIHAPCPEAFVLSLGRVLVPALRDAYQAYAREVDEIADGPTLRFLRVAIEEKTRQIAQLEDLTDRMLAKAPERKAEAEAWVVALSARLAAVGGVSLVPYGAMENSPELPGRRPFNLAEVPARDESYHQCRFYWPNIIEPDVPYGEGVLLQLRTAVSHFNEVWAVETAGAILYAFAGRLGWEFIFNAARWTYDESRHCRMGVERLKQWGFEPAELPLGTYIYDSARGQDPVYRLGLLYYFETKNIGKKNERAQAFAGYQDQVSQHDMEFDWADETIHAHYGNHWLKALHSLDPKAFPSPDEVRSRCEALVRAVVDSATAAERSDIRQVAEALIAKAQRIATSKE